jgi:hypothetical protein
MDDLIRIRVHEALDVELPDPGLRSRVIGSLPTDDRPLRGAGWSFQWIGGFVTALLAVAIIAGLMYSRGTLSLHGATSPASPVGAPRYTVTAPLLLVRGQPVRACYGIDLSYPPAGCSGVDVSNVTVADIAGTIAFDNGTLESPPVTLVGLWDGLKLTLTESPRPTQSPVTPPKRVSQAPPTNSKGTDLEIDGLIARDAPSLQKLGVVVLSLGIGTDGVDMILAVADATSVETLYSRYGRVQISGWLQPA